VDNASSTVAARIKRISVFFMDAPFLLGIGTHRIPSFRTLANHSDSLINFYGKAETLAEALSLIYDNDEIHESMLAVLGMVELELNGPEEQ
jgi:hypothetical protein